MCCLQKKHPKNAPKHQKPDIFIFALTIPDQREYSFEKIS